MDDRNLYGRAIDPDKRGRHATLSSALDASLKDLLVERNDFFDSLAEGWSRLFPSLPIRPGRYEAGYIYLYVRSAPARFAMEPRMPAIRRKIASLPGAPRRLKVLLEIHPE